MRLAQLIGCLSATLAFATPVCAVELARAVTPTLSGETNVTGFSIGTPTGFLAPVYTYWVDFAGSGDTFGYSARFNVDNPSTDPIEIDPAFALLDDTAGTFPTDMVGIVKSTDFDNFFGISDTVNPDTNGPATGGTAVTETALFTATWSFDVSAAVGGLTIGIDLAAMGDFEATGSTADMFAFSYSFDGANFVDFLPTVVREDIDNASYTLEAGTVVLLNDPVEADSTLLTNEFRTFSSSIGAAQSSTLSVRFTGQTDAAAEGLAFRNLTVSDNDISAGTVGDYNNDGVVDAADYTVWRDNLGLDGSGLSNRDPSQTGPVDGADYSFWKGTFGQPAVAAIAGSSVPEPSTLLIALSAGLALVGSRRFAAC
ncbi:hypothetical protein Pla175_29850 [Pirellulimonas nuda]|uniref:PEP-CTERM protein-sorting domain-containing protein n=1 Tax=Pirellulimonas nuda TaxID=2528009 RepID=A0A518DDP6_9BACT|nr:hypothetical protein [Pirellulimonas nuda]QDU89593.1 hypothetical protein Pla175_29850 [Pirellulimonas nuda]